MILTVEETSDYLKVKPATVRRLAREGRIPARKVGKSWRFWKENIEAWVKESEQSPCSNSISEKTVGTLKSISSGNEYENLLGLPAKR